MLEKVTLKKTSKTGKGALQIRFKFAKFKYNFKEALYVGLKNISKMILKLTLKII